VKIAVCTLFEHHYHRGVAILVNSLCHSGFTGTVYAGFRGPLPPWAESHVSQLGPDQWEMAVSPGVTLRFLSLKTSAHFTNYKPEFLLQIEMLAGADTEGAIYCDPDIVVEMEWKYLEDWLSCGIALCEDVNSPLSRNHPARTGWKKFFQSKGIELAFRGVEYANGGFIGLLWEYRAFLVTWHDFMAQIATALGGTDVAGISGGKRLRGRYGFADCFRQPDQDALNAALEACPEIPVSFLGPQVMGFIPGRALLPHALGPAKPWVRSYLREALGGCPPTAVDKAFWRHAEEPLSPFTLAHLSFRRFQLILGTALGRFIRRSQSG